MTLTQQTPLTHILSLKNDGKRVCLVYGNFNIIHPGHMRFLLFAAEQADHLIVGVYDKEASIGAYFDNSERVAAINALSFVDAVTIIDNGLEQLLTTLKPDVVVKGKEFEKADNPEIQFIKQNGGKLIFSSGEKQFSSKELLSNQSKEASKVNQSIQAYHQRYNLDKQILTTHLEQASELRVAIFGDIIVDEYQECLAIGMSQEDPTIAVSPLESFCYLGGAGIVAAHAANIGAKVSLFSVIGNDKNGKFAKQKLGQYGVDAQLSVDASRPTTHKLRYRAKNKTLLRVNNFRKHDISEEIVNELVDCFEASVKDYDLVIFSDFSFGVDCPNLIEKINQLCATYQIERVADSQTSSQTGDLNKFSQLLLTSPTELEARQAAGDESNGLVQVSTELGEKLEASNLIVTLGAEGVLIRHKESANSTLWETDNLPALSDTAIDTAGAGDAFLVATSLMLKTGASIWQAAFVGSIASAVQVNVRGNIPIKKAAIQQKIDEYIK